MKRNTKQKSIILESLKKRTDHPTARKLHEDLKKDMPSIGIATVYRNLAELVEIGEVLKIKTEEAEDRFDGNIEPHIHFKCEKCGKLSDIFFEDNNLKKINNNFNNLATEMNFIMNSWQINLTGTCEKCK